MLHRAALLSSLTLTAALLAAAPALAAESLTPSPAQLEFGAVDLHFGGSPRQTVQLANETSSEIAVDPVAIGGADASRFQIVGDDCSGRFLQSNESCSVEVAFQAAAGPQSATLELPAGEASVSVALSGDGITGTLSASPDPVRFSPIPLTPPNHEGEYQETEQVNVSDSQDAGTQVESVAITGPDAESFSVQWGDCEHDLLAPGNSCSLGIRFAASSPGAKRASLVLESDSAGSPIVIPLEAEALHGPQLTVDSSQALLGDLPIGSSAQHTFKLTSTGDYPLVIQQDFLISGTPLMFPILSDTCAGEMLAAGSSCELTVGFEPTTPGEKDASILLITNASPIHVLGIDGVAVQSFADSTPAISPSPAPPEPAAPSVATASAATAVPATAAQTGTLSPSLGPAADLFVQRNARLNGPLAAAALDTGFLAQCPPRLPNCQAVSFATASVPTRLLHRTTRDHASSSVLLGSRLLQLQAGERTTVRIPLSQHAIALLDELGGLRVRIQTVLSSGGRLLEQRTRVVRIAAPKLRD